MTLAAHTGRPLWRRVLRWMGLPPPIERWLRRRLPRRLFARSLLIIVLPMLILEAVVAFVFLDRHWQNMSRRLSVATASEIAALSELLEEAPADARGRMVEVAGRLLFTEARLLDTDTLPRPAPKPFFSLLDRILSREISRLVGRPFWIDTVGSTRFVEVRVKLSVGVLRIVTRRSQTYASNSQITLAWMAGTSLVLIAVALLFLKGQVRPIQDLADAAERFGRGQPVRRFRPHGAIEVRQAAWAFLEMKGRIERQIDQRTAMLAGVSHDLRTMLTRFRLDLALIAEREDVAALTADVDMMQAMVEDYLAFARADSDERADNVSVADLLSDASRGAETITIEAPEDLVANLRPTATRRLMANIIDNAAQHASRIAVRAELNDGTLRITVDDDGPGIPAAERDAVFRPFYRTDSARNQNRGGTGLGLTIARDIARRQGGDVRLADSPLGGLRVAVTLPQ